jgi:hypothetical protein
MQSATEDLERKSAHGAFNQAAPAGNNRRRESAASDGALLHLRDFQELSEVPQRTITAWEQRLDMIADLERTAGSDPTSSYFSHSLILSCLKPLIYLKPTTTSIRSLQ